MDKKAFDPVTHDLNRHLNQMDESDAFEAYIEQQKEFLRDDLDAFTDKLVQSLMSWTPDDLDSQVLYDVAGTNGWDAGRPEVMQTAFEYLMDDVADAPGPDTDDDTVQKEWRDHVIMPLLHKARRIAEAHLFEIYNQWYAKNFPGQDKQALTKKCVKVANGLDEMGLHKEASCVDGIMVRVAAEKYSVGYEHFDSSYGEIEDSLRNQIRRKKQRISELEVAGNTFKADREREFLNDFNFMLEEAVYKEPGFVRHQEVIIRELGEDGFDFSSPVLAPFVERLRKVYDEEMAL